MKENLKTTKYANGDIVGTTSPSTLDISTESDPKCQWPYSGDENNIATYGRLYTWYAVTDSRNICPTGWHLPTDGEWVKLIISQGGESIAGGKLKETGTTHWYSTNSNVTNESGFTALPAGSRFYNENEFAGIFFNGWWWSSTPDAGNLNNAWVIYVGNSEINISNGCWQKKNGNSVRCIKN